MSDSVEYAQSLLSDLEDPELDAEARASVMFELAAELGRVGREAEALEWLGLLIDAGGVDGAIARVDAAGLYFAGGQVDRAEAELAAVAAARLRGSEPYAYAGELLADRGDDKAAVRWFTMAAQRLSRQELDAAFGEDGWASAGFQVLWQRRLARERLGLPPDDLDAGLVEPPGRRSTFPSLASMRTDPRAAAATMVQILYWRQSEFAKAQERWPELLDPATSFEQYRAESEADMRAQAERGATIRLIEARVDDLQAYAERFGGTFGDAEVRRGYLDEEARLGRLAAGSQRGVLVRQRGQVQALLWPSRQLIEVGQVM